MSPLCAAPDPTLGVAVRISQYLDCQARSLGENGFQALAGGPLGTSLLSGLVTIFVALIGYRMILGHAPNLRHGVNWVVRLGVVLALVTSWSAFQTLAYRTVIDGPAELAAIILPASGLPSERLDVRVQQAYDTVRLGTFDGQGLPANAIQQVPDPDGAQQSTQQIHFQSPLPNTASLLVISTSGLAGILKIAVGFLLAIAPTAMMSLLFDATLGFFNGWIRALVGLALAALGVTVITAADLMLVESELGRLQSFRMVGVSGAIDPQALTTIVALFTLASLIVTVAAMKMAGAFRLSLQPLATSRSGEEYGGQPTIRPSALEAHGSMLPSATHQTDMPERTMAIREALTRSMRREELREGSKAGPEAPSRHLGIGEAAARAAGAPLERSSGPIGKRGLGMRRRIVARRDKRA